MQKYVDTASTLPQYLVSRMLLIPEMGGSLHSGPEVERENRSRRNLHNGNEEESKKEKALTNRLRNDTSQGPKI
jgi:hypothetical protein